MNAIKELENLASYIEGMNTVMKRENLETVTKWLKKASRNVCGQGYFGCNGGEKCDWDHK